MIPFPGVVRVWLAIGVTDMRHGMNTLALQVQQDLGHDPHAGDLYVFRGRRGDLVKILWHDGVGPRSMPSVWSAAGFNGRGRRGARCRSARCSSATCLRGSIGGTRFAVGARLGPADG